VGLPSCPPLSSLPALSLALNPIPIIPPSPSAGANYSNQKQPNLALALLSQDKMDYNSKRRLKLIENDLNNKLIVNGLVVI
jgi:hypothetical protein